MRHVFGEIETHDHLRVRYGIWTSASPGCRGAILLLGGRTEFMEKYAETIGELQERGFDVFSLDWRGQGLSRRELGDRLKGYVASYEDYLLDLQHIVERIIIPRGYGHLALLGHSMGGHIALRFIHDHPEVIQSAVLVSPMFDILPSHAVNKAVRWMTWIAVRAGRSYRYAAGTHRHRSTDNTFPGNRLTSDPRRFQIASQAIDENPDLAVGGVTYGWLSATFRSIDLIRQAGFAEKIAIPTHILCAEQEQIVSIEAQHEMHRRMRHCELTTLSGARHEILMESDPVRETFWRVFDRHMDTHIPS